ncbi:hypothetical protein [Paracoccus sp. PAMC 22219]|uniref:hypothetical protein n=1 Tax=Paracoccus sp. PAMC 22219 TaxID=1569209 RepID=UPI000A5D67FC|nr:hypothetical protein [Paracoccus sp. PAMC 22219]
MLSPADRAICDRDPALAGLPLLLDADALAAVLGCGTLVPICAINPVSVVRRPI